MARKISRPVEPDKVFDMDSIDSQRLSTDDPAQENKKHILVLLDRFSGRVYAEATATRQVTESIAMLTKMLRDAKAEPPLLINMDAAGEFTSAEFLSQLDRKRISYRLKKPGREQKNALAMVDTAIGKLSRIVIRY